MFAKREVKIYFWNASWFNFRRENSSFKILQQVGKNKSTKRCLQAVISQSLLNELLKIRIGIEGSCPNNANKDRERNRQEKVKNVEEVLKTWFSNARNNAIRLSGLLSMQKAEKHSSEYGWKFEKYINLFLNKNKKTNKNKWIFWLNLNDMYEFISMWW